MARDERYRWKNFGRLSKVQQQRPVTTYRGIPTASWWMTVRPVSSRCDICHKTVPAGKAVAYHHEPKGSLCIKCAKATNVELRPSKAFRRAQAEMAQERLPV